MAAKSNDRSCAMEKPLQSGPSALPLPLPTWTRPCSLTMRAIIELKQHFVVVSSMQETQLPKILMHEEQYVPIEWHSFAPSLSARRASSSLHDIIEMIT